MADAKEIEQTAMIDREMDQVFDWAKGNSMPIRDAIGTTKWKQTTMTP